MLARPTPPLPLVKGTLDLLVLKAVAWGPMHGFEITTWIEQRAHEPLDIVDSALYQALYRMEQKGYVTAEWGVTENNRRARYYRIAAPGRAHLRTQVEQWLRYSRTVTGILTDPARASMPAQSRAR